MFGISHHHERSGCRALSRALSCVIENASDAGSESFSCRWELTSPLSEGEGEEGRERLKNAAVIESGVRVAGSPKPRASWIQRGMLRLCAGVPKGLGFVRGGLGEGLRLSPLEVPPGVDTM